MRLRNLKSVDEREVIIEWLRNEFDKNDIHVDLDEMCDDGLIKLLHKHAIEFPIGIFLDFAGKIDWMTTQVSVDEISRLQVLQGKPYGGWNKYSDSDGSVLNVAKNIKKENIPKYDDEIDVEKIKSLESSESLERNTLVSVVNGPNEAPMLFDGNHRATSTVLRHLKGGSLEINDGEEMEYSIRDDVDEHFNLYIGFRRGVRESNINGTWTFDGVSNR